MQRFISLMHQAVAEYSAQHFGLSIDLMCRAWANLEISQLRMSDGLYNALLDGVEMLDLMLDNLLVIERNNYTDNTVYCLKKALENLENQELFFVQKQLANFYQLLLGVQVGFSFFYNNNLSLNELELGLSFGLLEDGTIELYQSKNTAETEQLIRAFKACFDIEKTRADSMQEQIDLLLKENNREEAIKLLEEMIGLFPQTQKAAFFQLGELLFEQKKYQKATDAYMKSVVMGTSKKLIFDKVQAACNQLIRYSSDLEEKKYWVEFLEKI